MPGRLFLTAPLSGAAGEVGLPPPSADDHGRDDIRPGEALWLVTSDGWRQMRWGLIPQGRRNARGRPVMETLVNARSETVFDKTAFEGVRRAALPVTGWYEWTGHARRKTRWTISDSGGGWLWFACVWDVWSAPGGTEVAQFATVTCAPNEDVAPVHDRMGVLLEPAGLSDWLNGDVATARTKMVLWPAGRLAVAKSPES
ncbi:hypothetical protein OCH239_18145 [Roseivivax halodurans JCM 10272]|uniref:Abasic site processing protein n=1 Tax=Roseivivax halodurans JCM 10272 TaxID=1449350 RepID=X7EH27_9RHOB|nr:SOS response-associated peptidase family protein [Roseivivax halodurans]ETX15200.1 hypothetical protein OCH239_18145 [Roseivivax halodurans JCM 10272]